ncbi:MAG: TIGR02234 family membrane protein [Rhodococcus sp.]|nr:TIGR02234 family membrane protein [Rhodococcus sp. (in: high G+C Gram-positive bacteria)]
MSTAGPQNPESSASSAGSMYSARRSTAVTVGCLALAAVALWASSRMVWVSFASADGLGEERAVDLDGATWAAALTPLALVLVAGIAASFAVKGWLLRGLGVLVALVGVAAAVPVVQLVTSGVSESKAAQLAELPGRAEVRDIEVSYGPAVLAAVGVVLALIAAVTLLRRPMRGAGLSSKYDAPATRREAVQRAGEPEGGAPTQRVMWDALDAGDDPTDGPDERPTGGGSGTRT